MRRYESAAVLRAAGAGRTAVGSAGGKRNGNTEGPRGSVGVDRVREVSS